MNQKIAITGASGLLGSNLVLLCRRQGIPYDALCGPHADAIQGASETVDLRRPEDACARIRSLQPDAVVHCAALTQVDYCEQHPDEAEKINATASGALARVANEQSSRFVFISTDAVFDGCSGGYTEDDSPAPVNVYGRSKWHGEQQALAAGSRTLILRTNLYGWNALPKFSLMEWVLDRIENKGTVPGFTDVTFAPLAAQQLARIILAGIEQEVVGLYHAASADALSKYDFARTVLDIFGYDPNRVTRTSVHDVSFDAPRPAHTALDGTKLAEELDIPMRTVRQDIEECCILKRYSWTNDLKLLIKSGVEQA